MINFVASTILAIAWGFIGGSAYWLVQVFMSLPAGPIRASIGG